MNAAYCLVCLVIFQSIRTNGFPLDSREIENEQWPSNRLRHLESPAFIMNQQRRFSRAITEDNTADELLDTAAQSRNYYYYPYFRIRRISQRRYDNIPSRPLSNYANDYDRFPTVA